MRRRVIAITLICVLALMVSPAGAGTTAWTAGKLTKAVKVLIRADKKDNRRDKRQAHQLRSHAALIAALRADLAAMASQEGPPVSTQTATMCINNSNGKIRWGGIGSTSCKGSETKQVVYLQL